MRNHLCDVFIAGAGPAGLAAAIALRMRGADVLIADALRPPIDKPCGEGLMPEARRTLTDLGLTPADGVPFTGITFASAEALVSADFPGGPGLGLRRTALHQILYDRADTLGVRFSFNAPVVLQTGQPPLIDNQPVVSRWIIGADGATSRVRAWARLNRGAVRSRRFGFRTHLRLSPGSPVPSHVEVHWGPLGQAYITPTSSSEICVSVMTRDPNLRLARMVESLPSLQNLLREARPLAVERGCPTLSRHLRRVTRGHVALIGDASGSVDAITGEGLALAFRQAILLSQALSCEELDLYESGHRTLLALPQRMTSLLLLLDRHPRLRARTLRAFAAHPVLLRSLLAVHVGEASLSQFLLRNGVSLTTKLLAAQTALPPKTPASA